MLKRFGNGPACKGNCLNGLKKPGLWLRFCARCGRGLWRLFAASTLLLFGYLLWCPGAYLLVVLFLQVLGLMVWLQNWRF